MKTHHRLALGTCIALLVQPIAYSAPSPMHDMARKPVAPAASTSQWHNVTTRSKVMSIAFEGHYLWLGLSPSSTFPKGGVIRHDLNTEKDFDLYTIQNTHGGLMSEGVYKVAIDKKGNKWFATYGGGLAKFDGKTWTNYTAEGYGPPAPNAWKSYPEGAGLGDMWAYDIAFDKTGTMWVATWKGASRMNRDNTFTTYATKDGLADKWVYALGIDSHGTYWFGTEGGVSRYDGKSWKSYTHKDGLGADLKEAIPGNPHHGQAAHHADPKKSNLASNPNYVMSLAIDRRDNKWFGTWGSGLSRFDGKKWKTYTTHDGLAGNFIFALALDKKGVLWAGTNGGVSRFDGKNWKSYTRKDGLMDDFVYSIGVDKDNNKWFGTRTGVSKLSQD
ncbi:MAG: two-component regulator propeller domain-containing protein [Gammaproteobacteria bacterium]|nr:two-component regulator propeller domain-containing protein [Gammaproteobacteria bacterium]